MDELLVSILSMLLFVALTPLYLWKHHQDSRSSHQHEEEPQVCLTLWYSNGKRWCVEQVLSGCIGDQQLELAPLQLQLPKKKFWMKMTKMLQVSIMKLKHQRKRKKKRQERDAQRQAEQAARESRQTKQDHYGEM